jgi:hypothetical protein
MPRARRFDHVLCLVWLDQDEVIDRRQAMQGQELCRLAPCHRASIR